MEQIVDFDDWMTNYQPPHVKYIATYNPETGQVLSVGPSHAFESEKYKIEIDKELAESIINAEIKIHQCLVDFDSNTLAFSEIKSVYKIDDVLHRVISKEYFKEEKPDVYLSYSLKNKMLTIQLSEELGGTKKIKSSISKRAIIWNGDTEMKFLVTDYNDPNLIFEMFSVKINELIGKTKTINNITYNKFSVYTRRLFKNYVIEYK
jgi:hypothetical protein